MKEIINEALELSFKQDRSLPTITAQNLKELLERTLNTLDSARQMNGEFNLYYWFTLPTLVNTFLLQLSRCLLNHLLQRNSMSLEKLLLLKPFLGVIKQTPRGTALTPAFTIGLNNLIDREIPCANNYFPDRFFDRWTEACTSGLRSRNLQQLLQ